MHVITSTERRVDASIARLCIVTLEWLLPALSGLENFNQNLAEDWYDENWCTQACEDKEFGALAAGSKDWLMTMGTWSWSFAFASQPAVDHPAAFRWHASSKKNRPSWCLFPFQMARVLPLRTVWIADNLSQASLRNVHVLHVVQRQRCCKRGCRNGQRLWNYVYTARLSDLPVPFQLCASALKGEVRRSPEPFAKPSAGADSEERHIFKTCLLANSVGLWKDDCLILSPIVEYGFVWEGLWGEERFWRGSP